MSEKSKFVFKLTGGRHFWKGKAYKKGDIIHTDTNLAEKFLNKFEVVRSPERVSEPEDSGKPLPEALKVVKSKGQAPSKAAKKAPDADEADEDGDEGDTEDENAIPGDDVTSKFPTAVKNGLSVYEVNNGYNVHDLSDSTNPKLLNKEPLLKKKVKAFIADWLDGDNEAE